MEQGWIIVGLGNPGPKYVHTPHNVGFEVLERFAEIRNRRFRRCFGLPAQGASWQEGDSRIRLLKPTTFMNGSGIAVRKALRRWKCGPENLLVVFDDVELPLGTIRLRQKGGTGGHNGMASIIRELDNQKDFARLRMGVGPRPSGDQLIEYLLSPWTPELEAKAESTRKLGTDALDIDLRKGVNAAMNILNRRGEHSGATEPQPKETTT